MGGRLEARCKSNFKDVDRIDSVIKLAAKEARARTYRVYGVEGLGRVLKAAAGFEKNL